MLLNGGEHEWLGCHRGLLTWDRLTLSWSERCYVHHTSRLHLGSCGLHSTVYKTSLNWWCHLCSLIDQELRDFLLNFALWIILLLMCHFNVVLVCYRCTPIIHLLRRLLRLHYSRWLGWWHSLVIRSELWWVVHFVALTVWIIGLIVVLLLTGGLVLGHSYTTCLPEHLFLSRWIVLNRCFSINLHTTVIRAHLLALVVGTVIGILCLLELWRWRWVNLDHLC